MTWHVFDAWILYQQILGSYWTHHLQEGHKWRPDNRCIPMFHEPFYCLNFRGARFKRPNRFSTEKAERRTPMIFIALGS